MSAGSPGSGPGTGRQAVRSVVPYAGVCAPMCSTVSVRQGVSNPANPHAPDRCPSGMALRVLVIEASLPRDQRLNFEPPDAVLGGAALYPLKTPRAFDIDSSWANRKELVEVL